MTLEQGAQSIASSHRLTRAGMLGLLPLDNEELSASTASLLYFGSSSPVSMLHNWPTDIAFE